jgi:hypothetical protein
MTIASRNRFIRIATIFSAALTIMFIVSISLTFIRHSLPQIIPGARTLPSLDRLGIAPWSPVATLISIGIYPVFSLVCLVYILFAFEKTQTVEITFFAAFALASSLEAFRVFIPLYGLWHNASFYAETLSRLTLFSRFLSILLILASCIFTTGKSIQQIGASIFLLAFFSLSISKVIPINTGAVVSNFTMQSGYPGSIMFLLMTLGALSALSYLILGITRTIPEYISAAAGITLLLAGYMLLALCDSWMFLIAGSVLFFWGAWIYLNKIHRYYLWQ